jgi:long-subunit acyl-CoA synthetase (AMP-forming)
MSSSLAERVISVDGLAGRSSMVEVFQDTAARVADRVALRTHRDAVSITWGQYAARVRAVAEGLAAAGIKRGDGIAILMGTRPEFHLVDTAALHLGAYTVSVYGTLPAADIRYLLNDSGVKILVTEAANIDKAVEAASALDSVEVVSVDGGTGTIRTLADLESAHLDGFDFERSWRAVGPDDLAVLIYTSGTTGTPKGVELTHGAILGNQQGLNTANGILDGARTVSYLPMAHVAERHLSHYRPMVGGFTVTLIGDHALLPEVLADFRPEYFFSPPRLYEKFRSGLSLAIDAGPPELRAAVERMLDLGGRDLEARQECGIPLFDGEVAELAELRATTGKDLLARVGLDSVRAGLTGSAPVPRELITFYVSLGMPLLEAWGLSECGAFGAFNTVEHSRLGTVGRPLPGVTIKLLDDGEILLKSPWLMRGYRNRPQDTEEAIDAEGWLHSGDVGEFSDDGFLRVVDRKKEIIINSFGKNMSPANIEAKLRDADPIISQAVAIGDGRAQVGALLVLDPDQLRALAGELAIDGQSGAEIVAHPNVVERVQVGVDRANDKLSRVERVRSFTILPVEWAPGSDELTPTMKLRRREIHRKYAKEISALP